MADRPDPHTDILELVRALARRAARRDHEAMGNPQPEKEPEPDISPRKRRVNPYFVKPRVRDE